MSVDHIDYPGLALSVDRGKVGDPSIVTLDWVTVDVDGQEYDRKLVLGCELIINKDENCRELTIVSVSGDADAVTDFDANVVFQANGSVTINNGCDEDRIFDVADGLGRAILHGSIKDEYPELVIRRCA